MNKSIKEFLKKFSVIGLDINIAFDRGISLFGLNLSKTKHRLAFRGMPALEYCIGLGCKTVLDVGSGGGEHARAFSKAGASVTCVDFGTSIYAKSVDEGNRINVIYVDFNKWETKEKYEIVWASHVLEHQRNAGSFIEKLVDCCKPNGYVAITVPYPHRNLWGGHLSLWTPGFLVYNCVMCGVNLSNAKLIYGYREFSLIFQPEKVVLPSDLSYDNGDLKKLKYLLPEALGEDKNAWY